MADPVSTDTAIVDDNVWQNPVREPVDNIRNELERRANTGETMDGFSLPREDLSEINLVNRRSKSGYKLVRSDLYRANLENAHLFKLDLSGSEKPYTVTVQVVVGAV